jgi:hypothetical protein
MAEQTEKVKVGDKLWYGPNRGDHEGMWVTVTRVGRRWFEWGHHYHRADAVTLEPDDSKPRSLHGRFYRSPEAWQAHLEAERRRLANDTAWQEFRLPFVRPAHVTTDTIEQIKALLSPPAAGPK